MIKVNLITEKRAKRLPPIGAIIPYVFVLFVIAGLAVGWFALEDMSKKWNDGLKEEKAKLEGEKTSKEKKVGVRDRLKKDLSKLNNEVGRLQRLSGANFVQWSTTMKTIKEIVPKEKVWITNLRIDSDRRVQITAYSCNENKPGQKTPEVGNLTKGIQDFIQSLIKHEYYYDVFLTGATKNVYEKKPVWRFELNCRLLRELAAKSED